MVLLLLCSKEFEVIKAKSESFVEREKEIDRRNRLFAPPTKKSPKVVSMGIQVPFENTQKIYHS